MRKHLPALAALLVVATVWGASFVVTKKALHDISPEELMFYRFALAAIALSPLALRERALTRSSLRDGVILGVLIFVGYWLQTRGLVYTTPARSAFLTGLGIVIVPILEALFFRVRIPLAAALGAVAAALGTALLFAPKGASINRGDSLTLLASAVWTLHIVLAARFSERTPPQTLATIQVAVVAIASFPAVLLTSSRPFTPFSILAIIGLAFVNTALAFVLLMWGQAQVTATEAAIVLAFEPVAAASFSVLLGAEAFTAALLLGGGLIVSGMILSQLQPMRK